jgi:UDP-N-acetylmuramyl pentapeptide phosphotransferase/UDP-N-acetylglucosamine-1-phosphate transferase
MLLAPIAVAFVVALLGGSLYLRVAPARALDVPNARSSHTRPVPRGGGLVIIAGFLGGLLVWLAESGSLSPRALGWLAGALLVALVSYLDDLGSLPALPRLLTHIMGALLLTAVGAQISDLAQVPLAFVYVVVLTNVYNFMDGIDGLATTQAIVGGLALALGGAVVANPVLTIAGALLAAGALGFVRYNLPPARLFMGDVGSTFLGFSFAGLTLLASIGVGGGKLPMSFGLVVFAPFLFDSLVTLVRRILRGERWYAAHRTHYYQRLVRRGLSHGQVTTLYGGLAVLAATAALLDLYVSDGMRVIVSLVPYLLMLGVVVAVWRLEVRPTPPKQPNQKPTVVTQG